MSKYSKEIQECIKKAAIASCNDHFRFSGKPEELLAREYMFTVNLAKQINLENGYGADPYEIRIEESTKDFCRRCCPNLRFARSSIRNKKKFAKRSLRRHKESIDVSRTGNIDVAVYTEAHDQYLEKTPECAIELKAFNPSKASIISDLERNLQYFKIKSSIGTSRVNSTFFSALHSYKAGANANRESFLEQRYRDYLKGLKRLGLKTNLEVFEISRENEGEINSDYHEVEQPDGTVTIEEERWLDSSTKHYFLGVVVEFTR